MLLNSSQTCEFQILESRKAIGNAEECAGLYLLQVEKPKELKNHSYVATPVSRSDNSVMLCVTSSTPHIYILIIKK